MIVRDGEPEEWRALPGGFEHTHEVSSRERIRSIGYRVGHPNAGFREIPEMIIPESKGRVRLVPWYGGSVSLSVREAVRRAFPEISEERKSGDNRGRG